MNRIALCLSGQPRYIHEGYEYINKYILQKYNVDVFIHNWWCDEYANNTENLSYNRKFRWNPETPKILQDLYVPKKMQLDTQKDFEIFQDMDYQTIKPFNVYSMFYSIKLANDLKTIYEQEHKFVYDVVIRCRTDILIQKLEYDLNAIDSNYIYMHYVGNDCPNDQFAFSSSKNMDYYASVFDYMSQYREQGYKIFVGEHLLRYHLARKNMKIVYNSEYLKNDIIK